jgi:hypothetical protein
MNFEETFGREVALPEEYKLSAADVCEAFITKASKTAVTAVA